MAKGILISIGWIALGFGIAGIFVPLLPTTPFLLVSAYCFSKTSPRFHHWLISHPKLGPPVRDWQQRGVIRLKNKLLATAVIAATVAVSVWKMNHRPELIGVIAVIIAGVLLFIWSRPGK